MTAFNPNTPRREQVREGIAADKAKEAKLATYIARRLAERTKETHS